MSKEDFVILHGKVTADMGNTIFKVSSLKKETGENEHGDPVYQSFSGIESLTCTISGNIRKNNITIINGDDVVVEISPYDFTRGRIVYRATGGRKYYSSSGGGKNKKKTSKPAVQEE